MTKHSPTADAPVLLIDDEPEVLLSSTQTLELEGFDVRAESRAEQGLKGLSIDWPGVVITDVRMPGMDGFAMLEAVHGIDSDIPVILITGHGDVSMALQAVRAGAYDFIEKPADPEQLIEVVRRALDRRQLILENRALRTHLAGADRLECRIIGHSPAMQRLRARIVDLADTDVDVLLLGETGSGKEVAARGLHDFGHRRGSHFVALNCGALPESMIESELFGHEPGAFTGALGQRIGKLEHANGGTLFLDEIESMPLPVQVRLLRALQERTIERLGGNKLITLDIRVIAATKTDLLQLVAQGSFREDLYYRLNVVSIAIPPLRERRQDIPLLFSHFTDQAAIRLRRARVAPDNLLLSRLLAHPWPGNVRELRNVAERTVLGLDDPIGIPDRAAPGGVEDVSTDGLAGDTLTAVLDRVEQMVIEGALTRHSGRITETADSLGILRKTLYLKMRKYGLDKDTFRQE